MWYLPCSSVDISGGEAGGIMGWGKTVLSALSTGFQSEAQVSQGGGKQKKEREYITEAANERDCDSRSSASGWEVMYRPSLGANAAI